MITSVKVDILDRVFHALVKLASPEKIMALHSTPEENERIEELTPKNRDGTLSVNGTYGISNYILAEKYVRLAKAHAFLRIKQKTA
jgi:hypothetical protein